MTIYVACRIDCESQGALVGLLGVSLYFSQAQSMCEKPEDGVIELEVGRRYPPGEVIDGGIKTHFPLCDPKRSVVSKMLAGAG